MGPVSIILTAAMLILIDNFDSFVHNLARYFQRLGQSTLVVRNDATTPAEIRRHAPDAIVLSPGPCTPSEAGCSLQVVRELGGDFPILGICLGHQTIAAAHGAAIVRAAEPMHGRTSHVYHDQTGLFAGIPSPAVACRYHSLVVGTDSLPDDLQVTATTADATIMALQHKQHPTFGLQFHPEAILTQHGFPMLSNFLKLIGVPHHRQALSIHDERAIPPRDPAVIPDSLTF